MRQIVLDTETTGLEPSEGHRIIEIGCVELVDRCLTRNNFHQYLQPDREIDPGATEVHGITNAFLRDKPRFRDIAEDFLEYIRGAELIIHNAPFDLGFLDHELGLWRKAATRVDELCRVTDTLAMARSLHPGQRNSLDALCKRYAVDNSQRDLHGALLDAEILADVYLAMTGGQVSLSLGAHHEPGNGVLREGVRRLPADRAPLPVVLAADDELRDHRSRLAAIDKASGGECLWLKKRDAADRPLPVPRAENP
jgi:DNA polymerase-3 subunit epsilon